MKVSGLRDLKPLGGKTYILPSESSTTKKEPLSLNRGRLDLESANMSESDVLDGDEEGQTVPWHFAVGGAVDESVDGVRGGVDIGGSVDALQGRAVWRARRGQPNAECRRCGHN